MTELAVTEPNGISLLAALEQSGAIRTVSLELPADLDYDTYESIGALLKHTRSKINWLIGDWLNYGELNYGHKYSQAESILGLSEYTLRNIASIAHRVKPAQRSKVLDFSVHEPVAKLEPVEQRRMLRQAEKERMTRDQVYRLVAGENGSGPQSVEREICSQCGRPLP